jgi:hypothetical protein
MPVSLEFIADGRRWRAVCGSRGVLLSHWDESIGWKTYGLYPTVSKAQAAATRPMIGRARSTPHHGMPADSNTTTTPDLE